MDNFSKYRECRAMEDLLLESLESWPMEPEVVMQTLENLDKIEDIKREYRKKVLVINN